MWKRVCMGVSLVVTFFIGVPLPIVFAEEVQIPETNVLERVLDGYVVSHSGHPAFFDGKTMMPVFENDIGRIYAVTKFEKLSRDTQIKYLWFFRDQIIHDATQPLRENQIRAQSGLTLKPKWTGKWRVDVTSSDGTLLYSIPFMVHRKPEAVQASPVAPTKPEEEGTPFSASTSIESTTVP